MGGLDDDIPVPDIPIRVYVIIGCVAALLAGSQLLGLWLTGFKKPTPSKPVYIRILYEEPSSWTFASFGEVAIRVPPAAAIKTSGEIRRSEESKETAEINESQVGEDIKKVDEVKETEGIKEKLEV
ncbi:hypothetical protein B0T21DRAFT_409652 [Apiosordaria backusii]|uniref:Uncharacterized protein n=1 Tax=Apiosordaria backusii TaxID=314023 RepID=A0AA40EI37_9PEZI|nr:hypothetical protein B0T21DRAFT_409652 [Apiosordaria backusii]